MSASTLPTLAKPAAIRKVTDVLASFDAGQIAPCRVGSVVALHIGTPQGEIIVRIAEKEFIKSCRGPADHHGNPWRTLEELKAAHERETGEAARPEDWRERADPCRYNRHPTEETKAIYLRIAARVAREGISWRQATECECEGIDHQLAYNWCRVNGLREAARKAKGLS